MYDNIGNKIKGLALATAVFGIIGSVIVGFFFAVTGSTLVGFLIILVGALVSWVSTWLLYGFGELIENSRSISESCREINRKMPDTAVQQTSGVSHQTGTGSKQSTQEQRQIKIYDVKR